MSMRSVNKRGVGTACAIAGAVIGTAAIPAAAQGENWSAQCQNYGSSTSEPYGDQPGHNLIISQYSCRVTGGVMDGGITTGVSYWDATGGKWRLLSGNGAARKAGAFTVFEQIEGNLELVMRDGKPAGWTANGRARYKSAAGTAADQNGRTFRWQAKATGFNMFTIETAAD
jgi:hypothetical protein